MPKSKAIKPLIKNPAVQKLIAGATASLVDEVLDNKFINAAEGALVGSAVGGPIGAVGGGIAGWYLADTTTVMPVDMIAIPAYQGYMIQGNPAFEIFIRAGETIVATGGNVEDVQQVVDSTMAMKPKTVRRKGGGLPRKFAKMGFKKGWAAYKKTPAYKKKLAAKKKRSRRKK